MPAFQELVLVGRVVKPQGRHGEVAVVPITDREDRFPRLAHAFLPGDGGEAREVRVERVWPHKGRFVVKLAGVDSIDAAEALRGLELRIAEQELAELPQGSYYYHQLVGLQVEDEAGAALGTVSDVLETGAEARVLVVRGEVEETLVPFAAAFVREIDLERRRMVVLRPEYAVAD
jgi:16S rRNA processing protein RimM